MSFADTLNNKILFCQTHEMWQKCSLCKPLSPIFRFQSLICLRSWIDLNSDWYHSFIQKYQRMIKIQPSKYTPLRKHIHAVKLNVIMLKCVSLVNNIVHNYLLRAFHMRRKVMKRVARVSLI